MTQRSCDDRRADDTIGDDKLRLMTVPDDGDADDNLRLMTVTDDTS
jgi:hypothetical protein